MTFMAPTPRPEQEYCIAVKRDARGTVPNDWIDRLGQIPGVNIDSRGTREDPLTAIVTFHASKSAHAVVSRELGQWCNIEDNFPLRRVSGATL